MKTLRSELCRDTPLYVCLFENIENAEQLHVSIREGELDVALVDLRNVVSEFHVLNAMNRVVNALKHGQMKTKSVHSELIYSLSPSKNIGESFALFGITEQTTNVLLACFHEPPSDALKTRIRGKEVPGVRLGGYANWLSVCQMLKVDPSTDPSRVEAILITRMATKDI